MAIVRMNSVSPVLTPEEIAELELAEKMPIQFDEDCPEMTDEMLMQFKRMDSVSIPISQADIRKVNALGKNYRAILGRLLSMALANDELVEQCM